MSNSSGTIPPLYRSIIHYDTQFNVVICIPCGRAVCRYGMVRHFSERVHKMKKKEYKPIIDCVTHLDMPDNIDGLPLVPDHLEPRFGLSVHDGWQCKFCPEFRTTGRQMIQRHMSNVHNMPPSHYKDKEMDDYVVLQSWNRGGTYWIVGSTNQNSQEGGENGLVSSTNSQERGENGFLHGRMAEDDLIEAMNQAERALELKQTELQNLLTSGNDIDDTSSWLGFTGWNKIFHGKDIVIISETRLIQSHSLQVSEWFNISHDKLRLVFHTFDVLMGRCVETLNSTSPELCRWLSSYKRMEPNLRPFQASITDYTFKRSVRLAGINSLTSDIRATGRACFAYVYESMSFRMNNVKSSMESPLMRSSCKFSATFIIYSTKTRFLISNSSITIVCRSRRYFDL